MDSFARAQRDWETPPEEPEVPICEDCGQDMEENRDWDGALDFRCRNQFCPAKFYGDAKEMAEKLVDTLDTVSTLEAKLKRANLSLRRAKEYLTLQEIESL